MEEKETVRAELGEWGTPSKWDVLVDNIMLLIILGAVGVVVWKIIEFVKAISV